MDRFNHAFRFEKPVYFEIEYCGRCYQGEVLEIKNISGTILCPPALPNPAEPWFDANFFVKFYDHNLNCVVEIYVEKLDELKPIKVPLQKNITKEKKI